MISVNRCRVISLKSHLGHRGTFLDGKRLMPAVVLPQTFSSFSAFRLFGVVACLSTNFAIITLMTVVIPFYGGFHGRSLSVSDDCSGRL